MIDVVYVLGKFSRWQDNELRYSLRSIEKHLTNFRNIYIVGYKPDYIQDVIHISYDDVEKCKETNIYKKILRACQETNLTDDFLFFNDDHFLLSDVSAPDFPFYCKGDLVSVIQKLPLYNNYRKSVVRTAQTLSALGLGTDNFDTHTPIIYNKNRFMDVMPRYDWTDRYAFVVKSMYANTLKIVGVKEADCKINFVPIEQDQILNRIKEKKVWSIGDTAINNNLVQVMQQLYPKPSRWEK